MIYVNSIKRKNKTSFAGQNPTFLVDWGAATDWNSERQYNTIVKLSANILIVNCKVKLLLFVS